MAKTNMTELNNWKARLSVAHSKFKPIEKQIKLQRDYYRGHQWAGATDKDSYNDHPVENMVYGNLRAILPRLNFRNPNIFVTARKKPYRVADAIFDTISASVILEIGLNYYYRELELKRETRKCIIDAYLGKYGVMELGYTLETEKVKGDDLIEINELIKSESPFAIRRSPLDLRIDPESTDSLLHDARWIALRGVESLEDIKKNPRFENTRKLKSNYTVKTDYSEAVMGPNDNTRIMEGTENHLFEKVEYWDIWDRKTRKVRTVVQGHDSFIRNASWPLELEGFPVEMLYFNENPDEQYPISDVEVYINSQDELNRLRSMQLDHVRRVSQRKYKVTENAMEEEEKEKLTHGGDGTIVEVKTQNALEPIKDAPISMDLYQITNIVKNAIREMGGVSDMEALASTKFEQATEPAAIERSASTIREDQRDTFEDFVKRITKKLASIIQQTTSDQSLPLNTDQFALAQQFVPNKLEKMAGPEASIILQPWLNFSAEDIQGDYDFEIEIGSTQPINQETRKRDAMTLYQTLTGNPHINVRAGTKKVIEAFKDTFPDPEELLNPEEQVQQDQEAQTQAAQQAELVPIQIKQQTDLQKTEMKVAAQREGNLLKAQSEEAKVNAEDKKTKASVLTAMLSRRDKGADR